MLDSSTPVRGVGGDRIIGRRCLLSTCFVPHAVLILAAAASFGQAAPPPIPATPIAIENTNASFTATDVDVPQANPARPTVTIPAHIPPTGYLQFEQGFVRAGSSPAGTRSQSGLSQTTKIALWTRLLVQSIAQPYARSTIVLPGQPSLQSDDAGDLDLGLQAVAIKSVGVPPTISFGYIRRLRSGTSANLDVGGFSQSLLVLLGGDLPGGLHYDSNLLFNEQNDGSIRRVQFGQTLALSRPLFATTFKQRLGGIIEASHFTQPFTVDNVDGSPIKHADAVDLLFVATYTLHPNLILDMSLDRGLTSTSTQLQGGFGFTYLLPHRLWSDRHPGVIPVRH